MQKIERSTELSRQARNTKTNKEKAFGEITNDVYGRRWTLKMPRNALYKRLRMGVEFVGRHAKFIPARTTGTFHPS
ncbi:hypothetical protein TNCV_3114121 [Trichonephila clavipes]|nr:hypothetical protein TNCV_3114121 [Trichonephila clavipes]